MAEFFRRHYGPDNAVLTLAGDIEPAAALAKVERWFGGLPRGAATRSLASPSGEPRGLQIEIQPDRVQLPRLYLGFRAPAYGHRDWYAGALLGQALAGSKASPWYQDLVYRRQIAQDVGFYVYPTELEATVLVVATCKPGVDPGDLERELLDHLGHAAERGPSDQEVERARAHLLTGTFEELETLDRKADTLSQCATYFDDPGYFGREIERYLATSGDQLRDFARRYLSPSARAQVTVIPESAS